MVLAEGCSGLEPIRVLCIVLRQRGGAPLRTSLATRSQRLNLRLKENLICYLHQAQAATKMSWDKLAGVADYSLVSTAALPRRKPALHSKIQSLLLLMLLSTAPLLSQAGWCT